MRIKYCSFLVFVSLCACNKYKATEPSLNKPASIAGLLKDIQTERLPSPYYHFDYDSAGRPKAVSFANVLYNYNIVYAANRINEMQNNSAGNHDKLEYVYDTRGRVAIINYADSAAFIYQKVLPAYDGNRLLGVEWQLKQGPGFVTSRQIELEYFSDGNLSQFTDHHLGVAGQSESTIVDRYDNYDTMRNIDDFTLLHPDFFEHLFLLPGVRLQKNNPGTLSHTGDGDNYGAGYTYKYTAKQLPSMKIEKLTLLTGANTGNVIQSITNYSYY